jgi:hypothetical protein
MRVSQHQLDDKVWMLRLVHPNETHMTTVGLCRPLNVQELHIVDALVQLGSIGAVLTYIEDALQPRSDD